MMSPNAEFHWPLSRLAEHGANAPERVSLLSDAGVSLNYRVLTDQVRACAGALRAIGANPSTRIAVILPNGPEMAIACLGAMSAGCCAPLNPASAIGEIEHALRDFAVRIAITTSDVAESIGAALAAAGVRRLDLRIAAPGEPIATGLAPVAPSADATVGGASAEPALVLHTSGTTGGPKIVPLTRTNLSASAASIGRWLELTPADRCLNVMPLFHVHGLVGCLLASLQAGAAVICARGFHARIPDVIARLAPSWVSAVPSIHEALLAQSDAIRAAAPAHRFRFIRSSSARLPARTEQALEARFGAPVLQAYGMTEAAHQMCSQPLPPAPRKPGSVGLPAGARLAIYREGRLAAPDEVGEVLVRGDGVTTGYERNPSANANAFIDGWLRTGDQGYLDRDGYLFLTGRLKEIVNRGGEKVMPAEVEDMLLSMPEVAAAAAFGVDHKTLGEDLAAAVVLAPAYSALTDQTAIAARLRAALFDRLAPHKIPSRLIIVDALPKNATGKLQRRQLPALLEQMSATHAERAEASAGSPVQALVVECWKEVLELDRVDVEDNFFGLGGDSLSGARVVARVNDRLKINMPIEALFIHPTVAEFAEAVSATVPVRDPSAAPAQLEQKSLSGQAINGHQLVAQTLREAGIAAVYGVGGTPIYATLAACANAGIKVIGARDQSGAVMMSLAYNYLRGALESAVIVSSGPAVTNCSTGIYMADQGRWPLLVIGGCRADQRGRRGAFQALDGAALFRPMTRHSETVANAGAIGVALRRAIEAAFAGQQLGPAYLDITDQALDETLDPGQTQAVSKLAVRPVFAAPADSIDAIVEQLLSARAPGLIVGEALRWDAPWRALRELVELAELPFVTLPLARGFLPDSHRLAMTELRALLLTGSDLVLVAGATNDWTLRMGGELAKTARLVLLGDSGATINALVNRLRAQPDRLAALQARSHQRCAELRRSFTQRGAGAAAAADLAALSPYRWVAAIRDLLPADAITILDGDVSMSAAQFAWHSEQPVSRLTPGKTGCMGVGVPFAIAAKMACPRRPVLAICGDFAFGRTGLELETAARHRIPIIVLVANNGGLNGHVAQRMYVLDPSIGPIFQFGADVRYDLMAQGLGAIGRHAPTIDVLRSAVSEALTIQDRPVCIDVLTDSLADRTAAL